MAGREKKDHKPMVSVIIPTYNRSHFVCRAIKSVLSQTYQDFEIIVVDDCSTDNSEEVIKSLKDERIRYIRHETNRGGSATRNSGIVAAQAEYIGFLDDDDEWLPEKLEKQMTAFATAPSKVGVIYSGFSYVSERSREIEFDVIPNMRGNIFDVLLEGCILASMTPIIRKSCFQIAGLFDETMPSCQDWDMWIRISRYYDFDFIPEVLAKYNVHGKQVSINLNTNIKARAKMIEKYGADYCQNSQALSVVLRRLGILYSLAGDSINACKYLFSAIKKGQSQKINYFHFVLLPLYPWICRFITKNRHVLNINGIIFYY